MHSCAVCCRQFCEACIIPSDHVGGRPICVMCMAAEKEAVRRQQQALAQRLRHEAEERQRQTAAQLALQQRLQEAQEELARQQRTVAEQQMQLGSLQAQRARAAESEQERARAAAQIVGLVGPVCIWVLVCVCVCVCMYVCVCGCVCVGRLLTVQAHHAQLCHIRWHPLAPPCIRNNDTAGLQRAGGPGSTRGN
jgi:Flp pilus assembly protein TadB